MCRRGLFINKCSHSLCIVTLQSNVTRQRVSLSQPPGLSEQLLMRYTTEHADAKKHRHPTILIWVSLTSRWVLHHLLWQLFRAQRKDHPLVSFRARIIDGTEFIMPLCSLCLSIPWTSLPPPNESDGTSRLADCDEMLEAWLPRPADPASDAQTLQKPLGTPFHKDLESLALSAKLCPLCEIIDRGVQAWISHWEDAAQNYKFFIEFGLEDNPIPSKEQLWVTKSYGGAQGFYVWARNPKRTHIFNLLAAIGFGVESGMLPLPCDRVICFSLF